MILSSIYVGSGATLDLGRDDVTVVGAVILDNGNIIDGTILSTASFDLENGTVTADLQGDVNLTLGGGTGDTVVLGGTNSFTGTTTILTGTLKLGITAALSPQSDVLIDGGTLDLSGTTAASPALAHSLTVGADGGTLENGWLAIDHDASLGTGQFDFCLQNSSLFVLNASLAGSGSLGITGGGATEMLQANLYTGGTTVENGTLDADVLGAMPPGTTPTVLTNGTFNSTPASATQPTFDSVTADPASGVYTVGTVIDVHVQVNVPVVVTGTPLLDLATGATTEQAAFIGMNGDQTLVFQYTVQAGDMAAPLDYAWTNALELNGGTICDLSENPVYPNLAVPGSPTALASTAQLVIDTTPPMVSSIDCVGAVLAPRASSLQFAVTFSKDVTGVAASDFALAGGDSTGSISSVSGSGASYTVTVTGVSGDGALGLNMISSGSIVDEPGNPLDLGNSGIFAGQQYALSSSLYFDADGDYSAAVGGSGDWTGGGPLWRVGSTTGPLTDWIDGADAIFPAGTGTVTLVTPITANSLDFQGDGATVENESSTDYSLTLLPNAASSIVCGISVHSGAATLDTNLAGGNGLLKLGGGTLVLSGYDTFTGTTDIEGGTLELGFYNYNALGGSDGLTVNATLDLNGTSINAGQLSGAGTITDNHTGRMITTLTVEGGTFSGQIENGARRQLALDVSSGEFVLTGSNSYTGGTTIEQGATLQVGNGGTAGSLSGDIVNNALLQVLESSNLTLSGNISGSGSLVQAGAGTATLSGDNSGFSGETSVQAGTLDLESPLGGTLSVTSGARVVGTYSPLQAGIAPVTPGAAGSTFQFTGSATDAIAANPSNRALDWQVLDASDNVLASGSGTSFSFTPTSPGIYSVSLAAADDDAASPTASRSFMAYNPLAAAAPPNAGNLDQEHFGTQGTGTVVGAASDFAQWSAAVPESGEIFVSAGQTIHGYTQDGALEQTIGLPSGMTAFGPLAVQQTAGGPRLIVANESLAGGTISLAAFNPTTGGLDTTFGTYGIASTTLSSGLSVFEIDGVFAQPGGALAVEGEIQTGSGFSFDVGLARFSASGASLGPVSLAGQTIDPDNGSGSAMDAEGNVVVAFATADAQNNYDDDLGVVRFLANGTVDTGFGSGGSMTLYLPSGVQSGGNAVAIQANGGIVIGGSALSPSGDSPALVLRLTASGASIRASTAAATSTSTVRLPRGCRPWRSRRTARSSRGFNHGARTACRSA